MKVLITGGTHGMGKGVARALAGHPGVEVIVHGRSEALLRETAAELGGISSPDRVSVVRCDLTSLRDVRSCVAELRARHAGLDAVFVNAGLGYAPRREETEDGLDPHFQVNYLSHFLLVLGLLDRLEPSAHGGRVIFNVTRMGELSWDDLQLRERWSFEAAIGQGMVAKHMFYRTLHELYAALPGAAVSCFGFEIPKTVWSNQLRIIPPGMRAAATVMRWLGRFISIDECGAIMAPLFLEDRATSLERSGRFLTWKDGGFRDVERQNAAVLDPEQRARFWKVSLELCGDAGTARAAGRLVRPAPVLDGAATSGPARTGSRPFPPGGSGR